MKRLLTGIQPSGTITLGNYIGAIKSVVNLQEDYELYIMVVDLHAITVPQEKLKLKKNIRELAALYIACGVDPSKVNLFVQSEVVEHTQLAWVLQCMTHIGELNRMTQYKDKSLKKGEAVSVGLYTYPTLMAADILLYDIDVVPVGDDQKQHLELTRDLAERFNNRYSDTFIVPEPYIAKVGARIMDLVNPTQKMSKSSENPKSYISMLEQPSVAAKKIKSAVTDSEAIIKFDTENKPGISNLLSIYSCISEYSIEELEEMYEGKSYAELKSDLADVVEKLLTDVQFRFNELINSSELDEILEKGRDNATNIARKKIRKVYKKIGLGSN